MMDSGVEEFEQLVHYFQLLTLSLTDRAVPKFPQNLKIIQENYVPPCVFEILCMMNKLK